MSRATCASKSNSSGSSAAGRDASMTKSSRSSSQSSKAASSKSASRTSASMSRSSSVTASTARSSSCSPGSATHKNSRRRETLPSGNNPRAAAAGAEVALVVVAVVGEARPRDARAPRGVDGRLREQHALRRPVLEAERAVLLAAVHDVVRRRGLLVDELLFASAAHGASLLRRVSCALRVTVQCLRVVTLRGAAVSRLAFLSDAWSTAATAVDALFV